MWAVMTVVVVFESTVADKNCQKKPNLLITKWKLMFRPSLSIYVIRLSFDLFNSKAKKEKKKRCAAREKRRAEITSLPTQSFL